MDFDFNGVEGLNNIGAGSGSPYLAGIIVILVMLLIILIPFLCIYIVGRWKMYKKAGRQGWESIVPIYSDWVYVEMAGLNWWWFFFLIASSISLSFKFNDGDSSFIVSIAGLVGTFVCNYNISKKLGKDTGFAVLMTIFPFIVVPMIGFSNNYTWNDNAEVTLNGPFDNVKNGNTGSNESTTSTKNTTKKDSDGKFCTNCGAKVKKDDKFCSNCGKEI